MRVSYFLEHEIGKTANIFGKAGTECDAIVSMAAGGKL